jgi:predicted S18 family serine protease
MNHPVAVLPLMRRAVGRWAMAGALALAIIVPMPARPSFADSDRLQQRIPILGLTTDEHAVGTVAYLALSFEERADRSGLMVHFQNGPGRFSRMAQTSTAQAIRRAARSLGLSTDSWTVVLSVPYQGFTIYGDSFSAMVALTVVALAKGEVIPRDRVITGTITPDGLIGFVSGIPQKLAAAKQASLHMILVPDKQETTEGNWEASSSMQVVQVDSVSQAYQALTGPQSSIAGSLFMVSDEHQY